MIDMSADAVARRLRAWSELSASSTRAPRVDMFALMQTLGADGRAKTLFRRIVV